MRPLVYLLPFLLCACVPLETLQQRKAERVEQARISALQPANTAQHADFRKTRTWKKKFFRDDAALALAKPENIRVEIVLGEQRGYFLVSDLIGYDFAVSTGRKGHVTPTGDFKIIAKELMHHSNLYGKVVDAAGNVTNENADRKTVELGEGTAFQGAPMPYFMRLTNDGVGMHVGQLPGYAASHGCIRLPKTVAPEIYKIAPVGTPVSVVEKRSRTESKPL